MWQCGGKPTQNNVVPRGLVLEEIIAVQVANHNLDTGVLASDGLGLLFRSDEGRVFVVRVLLVKGHEGVTGDVASDASADVECVLSVTRCRVPCCVRAGIVPTYMKIFGAIVENTYVFLH